MKRLYLLSMLAVASLTFYGCNSSTGPSSPAGGGEPAGSPEAVGGETDADAHANHGDHGDHAAHDDGHAHGQTDMEKMKASLANLSPEDAASAEKQHFCPVSGAMLGTMGVPKKVDVNGQQVWICCDECKGELMANPEKYLAKLKP